MPIPGVLKLEQKQTRPGFIDVVCFKHAGFYPAGALMADQGFFRLCTHPASHLSALGKVISAELYEKRLALLCLTVSLLLHTLVMQLMHAQPAKPPPHREVLIVEWGGVVSNQQLEEKHQGETLPSSQQQKPIEAPKEKPKKVNKTPRKAPEPLKAPQPLERSESKPEPQTQAQAEPQPAQQSASATAPQGVDAQQIAQQLAARESELSLMRKYLAGLKQAIQSHLEYPQEAREPGNLGAAVILRFTLTESGDILAGSLSINKSSGSAVLDAKALEAAQSAAPMARPPRQMTVTITVVFAQDG